MSHYVLVVEDNAANQALLRAVLERDGFTVAVAGSAPEARERLAHDVPDLILMDIQLPGQDGLSFTRELRATGPTAQTPIVALTAHAMMGYESAALDAGCNAYITKPIDTRRLPRALRDLLAG